MHGLADHVVAAERKRDIAHAARYMTAREDRLKLPSRLNEVHRVFRVFLHPRCHRKNVGVEDNITIIETDLRGENIVGTPAY